MKRSSLTWTGVTLFLLACTSLHAQAQTAEPANPEAVRGIVRAQDEAWIASDLAVPIIRLPFKESMPFKKGDVLIGYDCAILQAQQKSADAKMRVELIGYRNYQQLKAHRAAGQFDVDQAKAKSEAAKADRDAILANLRNCEFVAPFNGQIGQLAVHLHEIPERGARVMQILDSSALEVDMIVPSNWLKWLSVGSYFTLEVDELNTDVPAEIVRIAAQVDAVSQTVKVVGKINGDRPAIRPGMSGTVIFEKTQ